MSDPMISLEDELRALKLRLTSLETRLIMAETRTPGPAKTPVKLVDDPEGEDPLQNKQITKTEVIVADREPVTYHSITRKQCEYKVVSREIRVHPEVDTSGLRTSSPPASVEFVASGSIKAEFEAALKVEATIELLTAWQAITGLPVPAGVRANAQVEASLAAKMAAQLVFQVNIRIIKYIYTVEGTLRARLVFRIKDLWDWVGDDCADLGIGPDPTIQEYEVKGPYEDIPMVPLRYTFLEICAPSLTPLGTTWSDLEFEKGLRETLRSSWSSGALRRLPLPPNLPPPL